MSRIRFLIRKTGYQCRMLPSVIGGSCNFSACGPRARRRSRIGTPPSRVREAASDKRGAEIDARAKALEDRLAAYRQALA